MDSFLTGFCDELLKVAVATAAAGGPTWLKGSQKAPVINSIGPTNALSKAIPTQRMESPAKRSIGTWRPSPGIRAGARAQTAVKAKAPPRRGRSKPPAQDQGLAFESGMGRTVRKAHEFITGAGASAAQGKPMVGKTRPPAPHRSKPATTLPAEGSKLTGARQGPATATRASGGGVSNTPRETSIKNSQPPRQVGAVPYAPQSSATPSSMRGWTRPAYTSPTAPAAAPPIAQAPRKSAV